jgi:hypothetical protein
VQVVVSCFPVDHAAVVSRESAACTPREAEVLLRLLRRQTAAAAAEQRAQAMARRVGGGGGAPPPAPTAAMAAAAAAIRQLEMVCVAYCWQVRACAPPHPPSRGSVCGRKPGGRPVAYSV